MASRWWTHPAGPAFCGPPVIMLTSAGPWAGQTAASTARDRLDHQAREAFRPARCDPRRPSAPRLRRACTPTDRSRRRCSGRFGCWWPRTTRSIRRWSLGMLAEQGHEIMVVEQRARSGAPPSRTQDVRHRADGRADAGDERRRGDQCDSEARASDHACPDRRDDGARDDRRSRTVPRRWNGRVRLEAAACRGSAGTAMRGHPRPTSGRAATTARRDQRSSSTSPRSWPALAATATCFAEVIDVFLMDAPVRLAETRAASTRATLRRSRCRLTR